MKTTEENAISPVNNSWPRMMIVGAFFILGFTAVAAKAVHLQVFCYEELSQRASKEYERSIVTHGKRGIIYDSRYRELAISVDATSIGAFPKQIESPQTTAKLLAKILKIDGQALKEKFGSKRSFVWVERNATPKQVSEVKDLNLKGIAFLSDPGRVYPNKTVGGQIIGFTDIDGKGLEGVEHDYDSLLKPDSGELRVLKDALGRGFDIEKTIAPNYSGGNLKLTIDSAIQHITETALVQGVEKAGAKSGMAVVMVPETGEVLAMANVPLFNPNSRENATPFEWRNRIVTDPYEPGSVMKIFTASAAIEARRCSADTKFYCEKGKYRIGTHTIGDVHPHGWLTLHEIVKFSSNIGACKIGETLGPESMYYMLRKFGFGAKTGIECTGETAGLLPFYLRWSRMDTGVISFGQTVSVSAIQLAAAVSAIANDGVLMKPYMIRTITDRDGNPVQQFEPRRVRRVISSETARTIRRMMQAVTETGGTGTAAVVPGYRVAGKTGTAQKVNRHTGGYMHGRYVASFVGFVPAEKPKLTIVVSVDEPKNGYYGGLIAAPIFKVIAQEVLTYLNIPPEPEPEVLTVSREKSANG